MGPSIQYIWIIILYVAIHLACFEKHSEWGHPFSMCGKTFCMGPSISHVWRNILYGANHLVSMEKHSVWGHPFSMFGKTFCMGPSIQYIWKNILYGAIHLVCLENILYGAIHLVCVEIHSVWGHPFSMFGKTFRMYLVCLVTHPCMGPSIQYIWKIILYGAIHLVHMENHSLWGHPFSTYGKSFCMGPSM